MYNNIMYNDVMYNNAKPPPLDSLPQCLLVMERTLNSLCTARSTSRACLGKAILCTHKSRQKLVCTR